jgi:hypothetical protein
MEIQELESKRAQAVENTRKIEKTLKEWEAFMKSIIGMYCVSWRFYHNGV